MMKSFTFLESIFLENGIIMFMIDIFLTLTILQQHCLNLNNSYKLSKTLFQYSF